MRVLVSLNIVEKGLQVCGPFFIWKQVVLTKNKGCVNLLLVNKLTVLKLTIEVMR